MLKVRRTFGLLLPDRWRSQRLKRPLKKAKFSWTTQSSINRKLINRFHSPLESSTKGSGWVLSNMGMEFRSGLMEQSMKENGQKARPMEEANLLMLMGMHMKASGSRTRLMEKEYISIATVLGMRATGRMIYNVAEESKHGQMEVYMKVSIKTERSMASANTFGRMEAFIREAG